MLELGRELAVAGHSRPAVRQDGGVLAAKVQHRFDGEEHAGLQFRAGIVIGRVDHVRLVMEQAAEAVAAEILNHGEAVLAGNLADRAADVAEAGAWLHLRDAGHHGS